jgi:hypothetical protein
MNNDRDNPAPAAKAAGGKRPYVAPLVRHEKVFEVMALSCGKIGTTQSSCAAARKLS